MKKLLFLIVFVLFSLINYSQEYTGDVFFPHPEHGYDWQSGHYIESKDDVYVALIVSNKPNKLGNYRYDIYMTSRTHEDSLVVDIIVGNIIIEYFSIVEYAKELDNRNLLVSKEKYQKQVQEDLYMQEKYTQEIKTFKSPENFKPLTMVVTYEAILIYSFFLPETDAEVTVNWKYIKKLK